MPRPTDPRSDAADRALLFWTACLPARYLFAAVAAPRFPASTRTLAAFVGARWVLNDNFTSPVGFFGGRAWWSSMRPWHGALWLIYAATGARDALFADVLLAMLAWLRHAYA